MKDGIEPRPARGGIEADIQAIPKAELHLHIEGTLEPEHMLKLADRNGVSLAFDGPEAIREAYRFSNLQSFLEIYYAGLRVLRTEQDFHDLTLTYLRRAAADNVVHAEIFFDPQAHTTRGIAFETVIEGLSAGMRAGESELGISSSLILCFLRDLPVGSALETLDDARPYLDRIVGVGLDSAEVGYPPSLFTEVFARARKAGLHCVAHAGEEGPADYIRQSLDLLGAERIDHGIRCLDDLSLVARLVDEQVPLTVCPLSNQRLSVTSDLETHPLKRMLDLGLNVSVNSDDPAYFGGYINANYSAAAEALGLDCRDLIKLAANSIRASFDKGDQLQRYLQTLDRLGSTMSSRQQGSS